MKTIYINGCVFTGSDQTAEAFSVDNGRFLKVGDNESVLNTSASDDQIVDLQGAFVVPGFIDSHMHVVNYGSSLEMCDLASATGSVDEMIDALREFSKSNRIPEGAWIYGRGWNQDLFSGKKEIPTRYDLDKASKTHPISVTRCCGHCLIVNSKALEILNIGKNPPEVFGGQIDVDENGEPTGVFRDAAMDIVHEMSPRPGKEDIKRMILNVCRRLNSYGITSCHTDDLCTFDGVDYETVISAYKELEKEGRLTLRIYEQSQFTTPEALEGFLKKGYKTGVGSEFFKIGPLKLLGDGSLGARTAYLSESYQDAPDEKGLALFTQEAFDDLILMAHRGGMQIAVHAIGDGVLDRILNSYEKAFDEYPKKDHRSGIVHVQLTREDQLERMKKMHLHMFVQTVFIDYDSHIVYERAGKKLADTSYAFKTMFKNGQHVSNGTDCPVENPNPMRGIECAVTRMPIAQDLPAYRPDEALTPEEALLTYTTEGAYGSFEENDKGRIQEGFYADFALIDKNLTLIDPHQIHTASVLKTYLAGECVYEKQ